MPDYSLGKIYMLVSKHTDKIYVGSTTEKYLSNRFSKHKSHYNHWKHGIGGKCLSFDLFELGINDVEIVPIECFPCNNFYELRIRERYYQDKFKDKLINKLNAFTSDEEVKEQKKQWYEEHKENTSQKQKQRYKENREHILARNKQWNENNKEKLKQQKKEYREKNREQIKEKKQQKLTCECGTIYSYGNQNRHYKSKKHINFMNMNSTQ